MLIKRKQGVLTRRFVTKHVTHFFIHKKIARFIQVQLGRAAVKLYKTIKEKNNMEEN